MELQNSKEFEIDKEKIETHDFEAILQNLQPGGDHVLSCLRAESLSPSAEPFRPLLGQMIERSNCMILVGPPCLEELSEGISDSRFHFVLRSAFEPGVPVGKNLEDFLESLTLDFWGQKFSVVARSPHPSGSAEVRARVQIYGEGFHYTYGIAMTESCFRYAVEKMLLFPIESPISESKDLAAELLNLMCGHLRSHLKKIGLKAVVGIPQLVDEDVDCVSFRSWICQEEGHRFDIFLSKEVSHVST